MDSLEQCFSAVSEYCKKNMVETTYNLFIRGITPVSLKGDTATLRVGSEFQRGIVSERYLDVLSAGFKEVLGFGVNVELVTAENEPEPQTAAAELTGSGENAFTFESYVVGSNNRFAYAAAQAVASQPSYTYNPLFIYGPSGLGKTHLMLAIKNAISVKYPEYKIIYVDAEQFTNDLIAAIGRGNTAAFHESYRSADVLLVDDVQFIAGKEQTQEEFFHTFNTLHQARKQIVLTSDRPPKEIRSLEDRMRSRFESGLLADISAPDYETRVAILKRKASAMGLELPDDVAEYIANRIKTNIRQLEGTVKKLNAYRLMDGASPSLGLAQNAIKDIMSEQQPIPVTVSKIIEEVARTFNIPSEDIRSSKQDSSISNARQIAMYIIREVTGMTMANIGAEFNGRNYATVVYALNKVEKQLESDHSLQLTIDDIVKNCRG